VCALPMVAVVLRFRAGAVGGDGGTGDAARDASSAFTRDIPPIGRGVLLR
jgi:hypothetical protein